MVLLGDNPFTRKPVWLIKPQRSPALRKCTLTLQMRIRAKQQRSFNISEAFCSLYERFVDDTPHLPIDMAANTKSRMIARAETARKLISRSSDPAWAGSDAPTYHLASLREGGNFTYVLEHSSSVCAILTSPRADRT